MMIIMTMTLMTRLMTVVMMITITGCSRASLRSAGTGPVLAPPFCSSTPCVLNSVLLCAHVMCIFFTLCAHIWPPCVLYFAHICLFTLFAHRISPCVQLCTKMCLALHTYRNKLHRFNSPCVELFTHTCNLYHMCLCTYICAVTAHNSIYSAQCVSFYCFVQHCITLYVHCIALRVVC